jgi:hypothetical protein
VKVILKNGKIYVEKNNFQQALLIEDGVIQKVGKNEDILAFNSDKIIDLQGKTVLPGINDSHLHLWGVGTAMSSCNLISSKSIDNIIQLGKIFIEDNKDLIVYSKLIAIYF